MSLKIKALILRGADGVRLLGPLDLTLSPGDRLGLVGESGSGKSLLIQALFGVLPPGVSQEGGAMTAFGIPMDRPGPVRDAIRGARLAWVPQDPRLALNPLITVGEHLALLPGIHRRESRRVALARLAPLVARLDLPSETAFLERFPDQLSGGQRQRLCLAMALSCDPDLLVLDEPTTALDPSAQKAFLELVLECQRERNLGFLWITHDLALASSGCDSLLVLYGGHALEAGPAARILSTPSHPYTARLLAAAQYQSSKEAGFLLAPRDRPRDGCPFRPRCARTQTSCEKLPPWRGAIGDGLRCFHPLEASPRA